MLSSVPFNVAQGAVFPYWILYLHDVLHFSTMLAGFVIGVEGVSSLGGALLGGTLQDHLGARRTAQLGALLEAVAYAGVIPMRSPLAVALCFALFGLSTMRYPARSNALLGVLPSDLVPTRFFSWDFMAANAGFGAGIVVGALVVSTANPAAIHVLFGTLALASVALACSYGLVPNQRLAEHERDAGGYRVAARSEVFWLVGAYGLLLSLASYSSFDTGVPALIGIALHASPRLIALGFLTNPVLIVLFQQPVTRLVLRLRWRRTALLGAGTFAGSWLVLLGTVWLHSAIELAGILVTFAAAFSVAEMLLAPLRTQLTAALAPPSLRGRYFGVSHFARGLAGLIGPSLAGALIGRGYATGWLLTVVASGAGAVAVVRRMFHVAPPELADRA